MGDSASSKITWLIVGAVVGTTASLAVEYRIKPRLAAKPALAVTAVRGEPGEVTFTIVNSGSAAATDLAVTLWATAPFAARTDVTTVEHAGGTADAACEVGIYQARLMTGGAIPSTVNTEAQAALVQCKRINPREEWKGRLVYQGSEAVVGLLAHMKHAGATENGYARFAEGLEK